MEARFTRRLLCWATLAWRKHFEVGLGGSHLTMSDRRAPTAVRRACVICCGCASKDLVLVGIAVNLTRALLSEPDVLILNGPPPPIHRSKEIANFGPSVLSAALSGIAATVPSKAKAKHRLSSRDCFVLMWHSARFGSAPAHT